MKKEIIKKILRKDFSVAVIGLGYVGLPLSVVCAKSNIKTYGYDNDTKKIQKLIKKRSYINTVSSELLKKYNKFFFPSLDFKNIIKHEIIIICVPTPLKKNKTPDLKYVINVINDIKNYLRKGQTIILECTSYPGTTEDYFLPIFKKYKFKVGKDIFLGYSPEREDPGNKNFSVLKKNIPKVVSGYSKNCLEIVKTFYKLIAPKVYAVKSIKCAEFTKLLENIYRSVNIGLINELVEVCEKLNIDINESINAAKTKPFGFNAFYPGPGVGGHCIPVDPLYLTWKAKSVGVDTRFIKLASEINENKPKKIAYKILNIIRKIEKEKKLKKILILGVTYKKNSDDIRDSPCIKIIKILAKYYSKNINICDPYVDLRKGQLREFKSIHLKDIYKKNSNNKFDILLILNSHDIFDLIRIVNKSEVVVDVVNSCNKFKKQNIISL